MNITLTDIMLHTPFWVWALLAALIALGLMQTRTQRLARVRLVVLPAVMLALGLNASWPMFAAHPALALAWLASCLVAVATARKWRAPAGTRWDAGRARLVLPASWVPLVLILVVFWLRYGVAVGFVLHPAWRDDLVLLAAASMLYGAIGGLFAGRAIGLLALTRHATMPGHSRHADVRPLA